MLHLANQVPSKEEGIQRIVGVINDGSALTKFREMIVAQGVRDEVAAQLCDDPWSVLPRAPNTIELRCPKAGKLSPLFFFHFICSSEIKNK